MSVILEAPPTRTLDLCWCFQVDDEASLWRPRSASHQPAAEEQTLRSDGAEVEGDQDHLQVT